MKMKLVNLKANIQRILLERFGKDNEEFTIALDLLMPELDNILNQVNIQVADYVSTAVSDGLSGKWEKLKRHNIKEFQDPDDLYRGIYYSTMESQISKFVDKAFQDYDQSDWELSYHKREIQETLEDHILKELPESRSYQQEAHSYIAFGLMLLTSNTENIHPKILQLATGNPEDFRYAWSMAEALQLI